jgi:hypothetical protein
MEVNFGCGAQALTIRDNNIKLAAKQKPIYCRYFLILFLRFL